MIDKLGDRGTSSALTLSHISLASPVWFRYETPNPRRHF